MFTVNENDRDAVCFVKAKQRGEKTFTLVGQDRSAPTVVCEWIKANIETAPDDKLREALEAAIAMRRQTTRKHPD